MSSASENTQRKYWAFISYCHADNREEGRQWATWLHHALETYEVPEDLVGITNERGEEVPKRIFPVFRDEEELATGDLNQRICSALDGTQVLVVLCSPRTPQSKYVYEEICYFKQQVNPEAIHAAVIEGELGDDAADDARCLPEPLRYDLGADGRPNPTLPRQPLVADFRLASGAQGWTTPEAYRRALRESGQVPSDQQREIVAKYESDLEREKLQLIAGVLGVEYGRLKARDKQYQLELARKRARLRGRWLLFVSVLALLIIAFLAINILQFREKLRADRVAGARKDINQARLLHDEHPIETIKTLIAAANVMKADAPDDWPTVAGDVRSLLAAGRLARIGRNVRQLYPTQDGKLLFLEHADAPAEIVRLSDLSTVESFAGGTSVSKRWGPNDSWVTIYDTLGREIRSLRDGSWINHERGLPPTPDFRFLSPPHDSSDWEEWIPPDEPADDPDDWRDYDLGAVFYDRYADRIALNWVEGEGDAMVEGGSGLQLSSGAAYGYDFLGDLAFSPNPELPYQAEEDAYGEWTLRARHDFTLADRDSNDSIYRAVFSFDGNYLLLVRWNAVQVVACEDGRVIDEFEFAYRDLHSLDYQVGIPATWILQTAFTSELVTLASGRLLRNVAEVDPGGRVALLQGYPWAVQHLATGKRLTFEKDCRRVAFSSDPQATFFVAEFGSVRDAIGRIELRQIADPAEIVEPVEPEVTLTFDNVTLAFRSFPPACEAETGKGRPPTPGRFVCVNQEGMEFNDLPYHVQSADAAQIRSSRSGELVHKVDFVVRRLTYSCDSDRELAIVYGSEGRGNGPCVVLRTEDGSLVWEDSARNVHTSSHRACTVFIAEFANRRGEVVRLDGTSAGKLSGIVADVQFARLPGNHFKVQYESGQVKCAVLPNDYFVVHYETGESEVWKVNHDRDRTVSLLSRLGLTVADSLFLPDGRKRLIVRHQDGRAYLIDLAWLAEIQQRRLTADELLTEITDKRRGPAAASWWEDLKPK